MTQNQKLHIVSYFGLDKSKRCGNKHELQTIVASKLVVNFDNQLLNCHICNSCLRLDYFHSIYHCRFMQYVWLNVDALIWIIILSCLICKCVSRDE
jgi:hypothetical protein